MFEKFTKKLTWIDFKLFGLIGIGFGILLAKINWFADLHWGWLVGIMVLCYVKIFQSLLKKIKS